MNDTEALRALHAAGAHLTLHRAADHPTAPKAPFESGWLETRAPIEKVLRHVEGGGPVGVVPAVARVCGGGCGPGRPGCSRGRTRRTVRPGSRRTRRGGAHLFYPAPTARVGNDNWSIGAAGGGAALRQTAPSSCGTRPRSHRRTSTDMLRSTCRSSGRSVSGRRRRDPKPSGSRRRASATMSCFGNRRRSFGARRWLPASLRRRPTARSNLPSATVLGELSPYESPRLAPRDEVDAILTTLRRRAEGGFQVLTPGLAEVLGKGDTGASTSCWPRRPGAWKRA